MKFPSMTNLLKQLLLNFSQWLFTAQNLALQNSALLSVICFLFIILITRFWCVRSGTYSSPPN